MLFVDTKEVIIIVINLIYSDMFRRWTEWWKFLFTLSSRYME